MKITVFFDGATSNSGCLVGWGFSCFLHEPEILFDTEEDPDKLFLPLKVGDEVDI